jgi:copper chaperone CopZ
MKAITVLGVAWAALVIWAGLGQAQAPKPAAAVYTKVTLTELHCMGCAKKIASKVTKVKGVQEMRVDLDARTLFIVHKTGLTPSPKELWVAIEETEHKPEVMETPTAKHKAKPQS